MADDAARNAFQGIPLEVRENIQPQNAEGEEVLNFLLNCQLTYHKAVSVTKEVKIRKIPHPERLQIMRNWNSPTRPNVISDVEDEVFCAFVWGEAFGRSLVAWCSGQLAPVMGIRELVSWNCALTGSFAVEWNSLSY